MNERRKLLIDIFDFIRDQYCMDPNLRICAHTFIAHAVYLGAQPIEFLNGYKFSCQCNNDCVYDTFNKETIFKIATDYANYLDGKIDYIPYQETLR